MVLGLSVEVQVWHPASHRTIALAQIYTICVLSALRTLNLKHLCAISADVIVSRIVDVQTDLFTLQETIHCPTCAA